MSLPELVDEIFHHRSRTSLDKYIGSVVPFLLLDTQFVSGSHAVISTSFKSVPAHIFVAATVNGRRGGKGLSQLVL